MPPKPVRRKEGENARDQKSTSQPASGGLVPVKSEAQQEGQSRRRSGIQQTTTTGRGIANKPVQGREGRGRAGKVVTAQAPTAVPSRVPSSARISNAPAAIAGQDPSAPTQSTAGQAARPTEAAEVAATQRGRAGGPLAARGRVTRPLQRGGMNDPSGGLGRGGMAGPPRNDAWPGGPGARRFDGRQSREGIVGAPVKRGMTDGMAGAPREDGLPGGREAGGKNWLHNRVETVGIPGKGGSGEGIKPDSAPVMGDDPPNYSRASIFHRSNPFIFRAIETVLAVAILAALIVVDLPLKKTVWIHFAFASPLIPIVTLFGVAALSHRNPLDSVFTLILLGFCFVMYVFAAIQVIMRWQEIKRNRAQRAPVWVTVLQLTFFLVITLLIDIIWYLCFLMGCPCCLMLSQKFSKKKDDIQKEDKRKNQSTALNTPYDSTISKK